MQIPPNPLSIQRRIEISQTDAAGLIHFTTYFTLMEAAEAELFRRLELPFLWREGSKSYGFPRIDCRCEFRKPLFFDSLVTVDFNLDKMDSRRLYFSGTFRDETGQRCASGSMTTTCATRLEDGSLKGVKLPVSISEALIKWKNQAS